MERQLEAHDARHGGVAPRAALIAALALVTATLATPRDARACGGFFCFTQPVDQSAERVLYIQEEGKVTAHIQISYTGDDDKFSWVLPLVKVPLLGTGSDSIFTLLEGATAPTFSLQWESVNNCYGYSPCDFADAGGGPAAGGGGGSDGGVKVLKEENVGPYHSVVIQGDSGAKLVQWLNDNGYQQPAETAPLLDSYATQGYVFLALQLQKDQGAGDLVPIVVTLEEASPCLPIRLTKLAVQPDMPIVTWTLAEHRAIPKNFLHVVINDAVLDWMQPGTNYKTVVSKAVDQASGHAFTTEMAKKTKDLGLVFANPGWDTDKLAAKTTPTAFMQQLLTDDYPRTTQMQALLRKYIPKPAQFTDVSDAEFYNCIQCESCAQSPCKDYKAAVAGQSFDAKAFAEAVKVGIVEPLFAVQKQFDTIGYLTRLYTTISADEMDKDPIFALNPDLPEVERSHMAKALPICAEGKTQAHAAKLTFADGHTLEVTLPDGADGCAFDGGFGGGSGGTAAFGKGTGPLVAGGGQPAYRVEVLDESGPPIVIDPRVADLVDAHLNHAKLGSPSLSSDFLAALPAPTWDPKAEQVEPLPDGSVGPLPGDVGTGGDGGAGVGGGNAASSGGCNAATSPTGATPWALLLTLAALALSVVGRRRWRG